MKTLKLLVTIAAMAATILSSCNKDKEITTVDGVTVNVAMPADFPETAVFAGTVTINDRNSSFSVTAQAEEGKAVFGKIPFGVYDISASWLLSNEEFKAMAPDLAVDLSTSVSLTGSSAIVTFASASDAATPIDLVLRWSVPSSLVFSRIYNFGTLNLAGKAYNIDKYIEIFNNSAEVQYVDGLYLGEAYGSAPVASAIADTGTSDFVYLQRVSRIPGSGKEYPVEPGKSIVIAQNAKNHIDAEVVTNTVDLSGADFEAYDEKGSASFFPADNASVPNLVTDIYAALSSIAKLFVTQGNIPVLFKCSEEEIKGFETMTPPGYEAYPQFAPSLLKLPADKVIDAVDQMRTGFESRGGRHLPLSVDAGYAMVNQKAIVARRISYKTADGRIVLQDTNNSSNDFVQITSETEDGAHLKARDYSAPEIQ